MTAIIDSLSTGKKVLDNYLLDQRPLNLDEMQSLNNCIVNTINNVQSLFRMIPNDSPIRNHLLIQQLAKQCGNNFIPMA